VLSELERRGQGRPSRALGGQVPLRQPLPLVLLQRLLGVEGVHLRRAAVEVDVDDVLGPGREVWWLRGQGRAGSVRDRRFGRTEPAGVGQDAGQAEQTQAGAGTGEHLAGGQRAHGVGVLRGRCQSTNINSLVSSNTWASCSHGSSRLGSWLACAAVTKAIASRTSSASGPRLSTRR